MLKEWQNCPKHTAENPRIVNDEFKKKIYSMVRTAVKLEDTSLLNEHLAILNMEGLTRRRDETIHSVHGRSEA